MPKGSEHGRTETQVVRSVVSLPANGNEWRNRAGLLGAASGLWIAHVNATSSNDPTGDRAMLLTGLLVVASLAALGFAISGLVSAAESRWLHVFCGRRVFVCGVLVLTMAVLFIASMIRRDPFQQLTSSGRITAHEIVDSGFILAALICMTGAGVAFLAAYDAYRHERTWPISMGATER